VRQLDPRLQEPHLSRALTAVSREGTLRPFRGDLKSRPEGGLETIDYSKKVPPPIGTFRIS
jgi:hypothetical protein